MKISIITPVLNARKTLVGCLRSVFSQSHVGIEHIVIDGMSSDGSGEILEQWRDKLAFLCIEADQGMYTALNKGIRLSTGEIIGILHADDEFFHPSVISDVNDIFETAPDVEMVVGNVLIFHNDNFEYPVRQINSSHFRPWMFRFGFMPAHTATFIRRTLYDRIGLYSEDYRIASDFDFFYRAICLSKVRPVYLEKTVTCMRTGGLSSSGWVSQLGITREIISVLNKHEVYSNFLMVALRLPIKFGAVILFRVRLWLSRQYGNISMR